MQPSPPKPTLTRQLLSLLYTLTHPGIGVNDLKAPLCGKSIKPHKTRRKITTFIGPRRR